MYPVVPLHHAPMMFFFPPLFHLVINRHVSCCSCHEANTNSDAKDYKTVVLVTIEEKRERRRRRTSSTGTSINQSIKEVAIEVGSSGTIYSIKLGVSSIEV
ncbi:unnamed protein product [Amoebophrya sp. A25]|nr:unnamed protein product [Amoebophrya sp. A25]|eukprot:GSA25T00009272001.1